MELVPLVCLCLLSCSGETSAAGDGAPPKPNVKILDQKEDKMLLQCEVQGTFPKPKVVWQTLSGDILPVKTTEVTEGEGSYSIVLESTVTKVGFYYCVARLEETGQLSVSGIFAFIRSNKLETFAKDFQFQTQVIIPIVVGVMLAVTVLAVLVYIYIKRRNEGSTPEPTMAL